MNRLVIMKLDQEYAHCRRLKHNEQKKAESQLEKKLHTLISDIVAKIRKNPQKYHGEIKKRFRKNDKCYTLWKSSGLFTRNPFTQQELSMDKFNAIALRIIRTHNYNEAIQQALQFRRATLTSQSKKYHCDGTYCGWWAFVSIGW